MTKRYRPGPGEVLGFPCVQSDCALTELCMKGLSDRAVRYASHANRARFFAAAIGIVLLGAGCASRHVDAEWIDPQFATHSLAGAKVFVVCQAHDLAVRRVCADQMAAQLTELGATPVLVPDTADSGDAAPSTSDLLARARAAGASAVLRATISPDIAVAEPGPSFSIGVGGFRGGRRSGGGVGVGVGVPLGGEGGPVHTGYSANGALTDVATGRLMWTAKATTSPSSDVNQQVATLARYVLEAARKAGLF
jgi:hypothetical protein